MIKSMGFIKSLLFGVLMAGLWISPLRAASSDDLDIHVQILATKSLSINTTSYDFGSLSVNTSSVSTTSIVVTNNSTALIETYTIQATNAVSDSGGTDWSLASSTGPNQYALGAQFSGARPADDNSVWTNDDLSTGATTCTDTTLGNGVSAEAGANVLPGEPRNLWFRMKTPSAVSDGGQHTVTVTISVL